MMGSDMLAESQPWDDIQVWLQIVDLGVGQTNENVSCTFMRTFDDEFLQYDGTWGPTAVSHTMTEVSDTGIYRFRPTSSWLSLDDGHYIAAISNATFDVLENKHIVPILSVADMRRMLGLLMHNALTQYSSFNAANLPEQVDVSIYPTKADTLAATNTISTYQAIAEYDGSNRLTSYRSTQES